LIQIVSRKLCPKARGVRVERKKSEVEVWANIFAMASSETCLVEDGYAWRSLLEVDSEFERHER
jgi:hypothetical protein